MFQLKDIEVIFNKNTSTEKTAFKSLNLNVVEHEFITIIGNNGAGKSSLQNLIAGNIFANKGNILINNLDITKKTPYERAKYIARVFQDPKSGTCDKMTIEENLSLALARGRRRTFNFAINQKNKAFLKEQVATLEMGLEDKLNRVMGELSGGQRQALSLLMTSFMPTKLLLLDEHTSALDPKMAETVMELTNKLYHQHKLTILMITHNIKHAFIYGTRTIMLQSGEIVKDLTGDERRNTDIKALIDHY